MDKIEKYILFMASIFVTVSTIFIILFVIEFIIEMIKYY